MQSNQFADAVHVIVLMMYMRDKAAGAPITSQEMAESVCANPVVIRRTLGELREAGLVVSQAGAAGGWRLARNPEDITLLDIYRATQPAPALALPRRTASPTCVVGSVIQSALSEYFAGAQAALEQKLSETTAYDVLDRILAGIGPDGPPSPLARVPVSVSA